MGAAWKIVKLTIEGIVNHNVLQLAAAVAFDTVLSLVPMAILLIGIAGKVWEKSEAKAQLVAQVGTLVGPQAAGAVEAVIGKTGSAAGRGAAAVVSIISLLVGATGALSQLQTAMNAIWNVQPPPGNPVRSFARKRLLSLLMLLVLGFILLVAVALSSAVQVAMHVLGGDLPGSALVWTGLNMATSLIIFTLLFAAIFKVLPDAQLAWRDVWFGAGVTAVLFAIGKEVISALLAHSSVASAYGAASSVVLLLLWVYYSALIVFIGAEFTGAYLRVRHGSAPAAPVV